MLEFLDKMFGHTEMREKCNNQLCEFNELMKDIVEYNERMLDSHIAIVKSIQGAKM